MWLTVKGFRPTPLTPSGTHTSANTPPPSLCRPAEVLSRRSTMRARNTRRLSRPVAATRRPCVGCCVAAAGAVTRIAPIWLPGNHYSPETVGLMRSVPGDGPRHQDSRWIGWVSSRCATNDRLRVDDRGHARSACQPASPPASCSRSPHRPATSNPRISLGPANATLKPTEL
jgi:hypothetical protein